MDPITMLLISLAVGATTGTINAIGSGQDTKNAIEQAEEQKKRVEEEKRLKTEQLELDFEIAKKQANKNADSQDAYSTMSETSLNRQLNYELDKLSDKQELDTFNYNNILKQNDAAYGQQLEMLGTSNTRNSTVADLVEMENANNSQLLQLQQDSERKDADYSIQNAINFIKENTFNLQQNRNNANDLRASFEVGGDQYREKQQSQEMIDFHYDNMLEDINKQKEKLEKNKFWNGLKSFFGGTTEGFNFAYNSLDIANKWNTGNAYNDKQKSWFKLGGN